MGGDAPVHPRGRPLGHNEQRLPGLRLVHSPHVRRQRQPGHQRHSVHMQHLSVTSQRVAVTTCLMREEAGGDVIREDENNNKYKFCPK